MDVDDIHLEGHWKRSPENDAAMAELARAVKERCLRCGCADRSVPHRIPHGGPRDLCWGDGR